MNKNVKRIIIFVAVIILTACITLGVEYFIRWNEGKTPAQLEQYYKSEEANKEFQKAIEEQCQWHKDALDSYNLPPVNNGPPTSENVMVDEEYNE